MGANVMMASHTSDRKRERKNISKDILSVEGERENKSREKDMNVSKKKEKDEKGEIIKRERKDMTREGTSQLVAPSRC